MIKGIYPEVILQVGGFPLTDTIAVSWGVMGFLFLLALWYRRTLAPVPGRLQNLLEWLIETILALIEGLGGKEARRFLPLIATLALFIFFSNAVGILPGLHPPTRDPSTPFALALVVFFFVHFYGIRMLGIRGYLSHYFHPFFLFPIRIIDEFSRTISLTVRLFGNMMGETFLISILTLLVPLFLPVPIQLFSLFTAAIQAYIFCVLSSVYLVGATEAQGGSL